VGRFLEDMLAPSLRRVERKAGIFSKGVYTKYPFQVNTHGLPPAVVEECLLGFLEARRAGKTGEPASFLDWIHGTFGGGFARHFFVPYNEKLYRTDLSAIVPDWVSWSIPQPEIREVVDGALGIVREGYGYNAWFLYPENGGIEALVRAVAGRIDPVETGMKAVRIRTREKEVEFESGETVRYDALVSTLPLKELLRISDVSAEAKEAGERLRYVSVLDVNLGIEGKDLPEFHWIYFPEEAYPFYRVGIPSHFCPALAPDGCSTLYVEIAVDPDDPTEPSGMVDAVLQGLERCGILQSGSPVAAVHTFRIDYAYVVYDKHRKARLGPLLGDLEEMGIYSVGRYGAWEYATMERSILTGTALGRQLKNLFQ
jgi:protoporphyrinogen oxidase